MSNKNVVKNQVKKATKTAVKVATKTCGRCGKTLPITSFSKCKTAKDGHQGYCVKCKAAYYQWERKQPTFDGRLLNRNAETKTTKSKGKIKVAVLKKEVVKRPEVKRSIPLKTSVPKVLAPKAEAV